MDERRFLTVREAADLARVSRRTIQRWLEKGAVQAHRPNPAARKVLIARSDVDPGGSR